MLKILLVLNRTRSKDIAVQSLYLQKIISLVRSKQKIR